MHIIHVLNAQLPPAFRQLLEAHGTVQVGGSPVEGVRVVVVTPYERIDAAFIGALPSQVGLIASLGVGLDHIDLAAAHARGIAVSNTPVVTEDTADFTMALLLAACRRLTLAERRLRAGEWAAGQGTLGTRVSGRTLGIVGFGAIGQAVARRAAGFNMRVQYWGPRRKPDAEAATGAAWCESLQALLGSSDIVSLNCPLTAETRHLIDATRLAQFRMGAVLVNTGRGPLIDEAALVEALQCGQLGAAGLDVFEFEPRVTPALLELENVVLTPHVGGATGECRIEMALRVAANIQKFLADGVPLDPCRP
jgi:glyoxylate reductase